MMNLRPRYDQMIEDLDIERAADLLEDLGNAYVVTARLRVAARVIMDKDDGRRIMLERPAKERAGKKGEICKQPLLKLLVGDQPPLAIEEQDAQDLVRQRTHRSDEILPKLRIEGIYPHALQIASHRFGEKITRSHDEIGDTGLRHADDPQQRLGRLCHDVTETAEFDEKRRG